MKILILVVLCAFLSGCGQKEYYGTMQDINDSISIANSEIAQTCTDALNTAKTPEAVVAIALTACQGQMSIQKVEEPEKIKDIAREVVYGIVGGGIFFGPGASRHSSNRTEVGGDYTISNGPGTASKTNPTEFIMLEPE